MAEDIEIELGRGSRIGAVTIVRNPQRLDAVRTASGIELQIPILVTLRVLPKVEPRLMISSISGKVFVKTPDGSLITVALLRGVLNYAAGITTSSGHDDSRDMRIEWNSSFADIAYIEKVRDGDLPRFQIRLEVEWSFLLPAFSEVSQREWAELPDDERQKRKRYGFLNVSTEPSRAYARAGNIEVSYPREVWIAMLRNVGVAENVLVEVPLRSSPPDPWESVWNALIDARKAFESGGVPQVGRQR